MAHDDDDDMFLKSTPEDNLEAIRGLHRAVAADGTEPRTFSTYLPPSPPPPDPTDPVELIADVERRLVELDNVNQSAEVWAARAGLLQAKASAMIALRLEWIVDTMVQSGLSRRLVAAVDDSMVRVVGPDGKERSPDGQE